MKNLHSPSPVQVTYRCSLIVPSVDIMNAVAENVSNSANIRELLGLTYRQYYIRHSRLLKTGIIKRKNAKLTLTSFGQLIYQALLKIATAFRHPRELIMIDAIKSTAGIPHNEQKGIINSQILDDELKKLLS